MTRHRWALTLVPPVLAAPLVVGAMASAGIAAPHRAAAPAAKTYSIQLAQVNSSGASGRALLTLRGDRLTARLTVRGLTPNAPHVAHVHGTPKGGHSYVCPTAKSDTDRNGIVNAVESGHHTGGVGISLTTRGDTGPESGLAVDRAPVADAKGNLSYERTFTIPAGFAADLTQFAVAMHGVDINRNGTYDFDGAGKSELVDTLPQEATAPAICGVIETASVSQVPVGGVETGGEFAPTGITPLPGEPVVRWEAVAALAAASLSGVAVLAYVVAARRRRETPLSGQ